MINDVWYCWVVWKKGILLAAQPGTVYLEEVTVAPSRRGRCHWDGSGGSCVSSCVIVLFSACVRVIAICERKIFYQRGSPSHHPGSVSSSFAGGWWHLHTKLQLISRREKGWARGRGKEPCFVWSDLLFWRALKLLMQSDSLFWIVLWLEYCQLVFTHLHQQSLCVTQLVKGSFFCFCAKLSSSYNSKLFSILRVRDSGGENEVSEKVLMRVKFTRTSISWAVITSHHAFLHHVT